MQPDPGIVRFMYRLAAVLLSLDRAQRPTLCTVELCPLPTTGALHRTLAPAFCSIGGKVLAWCWADSPANGGIYDAR